MNRLNHDPIQSIFGYFNSSTRLYPSFNGFKQLNHDPEVLSVRCLVRFSKHCLHHTMFCVKPLFQSLARLFSSLSFNQAPHNSISLLLYISHTLHTSYCTQVIFQIVTHKLIWYELFSHLRKHVIPT